MVASIESLYIYALEPPYDPFEILTMFNQLITQIFILSHATDGTNNIHYVSYVCLLERLSTVKIGGILLELSGTYDNP